MEKLWLLRKQSYSIRARITNYKRCFFAKYAFPLKKKERGHPKNQDFLGFLENLDFLEELGILEKLDFLEKLEKLEELEKLEKPDTLESLEKIKRAGSGASPFIYAL